MTLAEQLREESKRRRDRWKYALVECDVADAAADRIDALEALLRRIRAWDVLNPPKDDGSDARFWREQIDALIPK